MSDGRVKMLEELLAKQRAKVTALEAELQRRDATLANALGDLVNLDRLRSECEELRKANADLRARLVAAQHRIDAHERAAARVAADAENYGRIAAEADARGQR